MSVQYYKRAVDYGHGEQFVELINDEITRQWLVANQGHYTGLGNPELVGESKSKMRGYGFRKVSRAERDRLLADGLYA